MHVSIGLQHNISGRKRSSSVSCEFSFELVALSKSVIWMYLCNVMTANCLGIQSLCFRVVATLIITLTFSIPLIIMEGHGWGELLNFVLGL